MLYRDVRRIGDLHFGSPGLRHPSRHCDTAMGKLKTVDGGRPLIEKEGAEDLPGERMKRVSDRDARDTGSVSHAGHDGVTWSVWISNIGGISW